MLKHLRIQNLILVENATITFNPGLNILTGETGSGKSAIIHGLGLVIGERGDTSLIRKGCDKGVVEAVFDLSSDLSALLSEGGIDHEPEQELIIRREISLSGKSKIFINHQLAQSAFLRKLGAQMVQVIEQRANQTLLSLDYHRQVLDLFGDLSPYLKSFQLHFKTENDLRDKLEQLIREESQRLREIDICQREWEELEEAHLTLGEDEELFAEYTLLFNSEELSDKVKGIIQILSGDKHNILGVLISQKQTLETLLNYDAALNEPLQGFQNALFELQEVFHTLRQYQNRLNYDPARLQWINERLSLLNRLKRKYGSTVEEMIAYHSRTKNKLEKLQNGELEIENLQKALLEAERLTQGTAQLLTEKRAACSLELEKELTFQLQSLNMAKAELKVCVANQKRTSLGDDKVEFFLQANFGEHQTSLREGSSGGEISRILLALQTILAGKEQIPTLIFDEVDANIGGETAAIVGDKLKEIGQKHQVICITHFPQVASLAHYHFQISKVEKDGRTITEVEELDAASRKRELARMAGIRIE